VSATLTGIAWAVSHPRTHHRQNRRPSCLASSWGMTESIGDGHGHGRCPECRCWVDVTALGGHAVVLSVHPEVGR
jgi:hypothetical protein